MRLEETILDSIQYYPSLFPTRESVLNNLFCTAGNGYVWREGQLVHASGWPDAEPADHFRVRHGWPPSTDQDHYLWGVISTAHERCKPGHQFTLPPRRRRVTVAQASWHAGCIYPLSEYHSKMLRVPEDARQDWVQGAIETAHMVIDLSERSMDEQGKRNLALARAALQCLETT